MAVLDTSFLVDLQREVDLGERVLRRLTAMGEPLVVPFQVATEYLSGVDDPPVALHMLESGFDVRFPATEHVLLAARLAREGRATGRFPGWADVHVAASAMLDATFVVTANPRHFRAIGCRAWDYRTEPEPPGT